MMFSKFHHTQCDFMISWDLVNKTDVKELNTSGQIHGMNGIMILELQGVDDLVYPLVIKHGNGKFPMNGGFRRNITGKWSIFQHAMFDSRSVAIHMIMILYTTFLWTYPDENTYFPMNKILRNIFGK